MSQNLRYEDAESVPLVLTTDTHATLMDLAEQMDAQVGRDRTDQVMYGIVSQLPPDQAKALLGGTMPAVRPLGVRSADLPDDSAVPLFRAAAAAPADNPPPSPSESGPAKAEPETPPTPTPTSPAPTTEAPPPPSQPSAPASPVDAKPEQNAGAPRPQTDTEQLFGMPLPNDDDGDDTSRRARERVGARGFEVVGDDHQGPLTGAQITKAEHQQLLKEARSEGEWGLADGGQYWLEKKLGTPPRETNLAAYKDDWVRDHATTIKVTARRHGIPPEVLAGIVHTETGGMPDRADNAMHAVRTVIHAIPGAEDVLPSVIARSPDKISAGDVSIQLRHVARLEGLDPDKMTMTDRANLIDRLQSDKAYALDMAARYAKETLQQAYPGYKGGPLNDRQVMTLGYGYNMGYPNAAIDPENPNPAGIDLKGGKKSSYGPDLQRKLQRMRELLK